ncbi:SAM-dependent methyltransferase [Kitasatospora sp. NPDC058243]|uniref:SAM-dependent methyltransferase n=1 Tax=Kitasatospora sp. NPDC058243 TaxID=3346397 RepID=UPI0036DC1277
MQLPERPWNGYWLLDAYCCQGGASMGYYLAGFNVVGVDLHPQPRYPFPFVQADAVEYIATNGADFDAIAASPPCQRYSATQRIQGREHPDLIGPTRQALESTGRLWVIENVEDARPELIDPVTLCAATYGLHTYRHRLFEPGGGLRLDQPIHPQHTGATVKMGRPLQPGDFYHAVGNFSNVPYVRADMGVEWMSRDGIRECIPPAMTRWIGRQLAEHLAAVPAGAAA